MLLPVVSLKVTTYDFAVVATLRSSMSRIVVYAIQIRVSMFVVRSTHRKYRNALRSRGFLGPGIVTADLD
jgi:hypothetical protein